MILGVDITPGRLTYDDLSGLPEALEVQALAGFLKEDMLQIAFANGDLIDVSWRPAFDASGAFHAVLIHDEDWQAPVDSVRANNLASLKTALTHLLEQVRARLAAA